MDSRPRWDALRTQLRAARTACDAGDRDKALELVDAVLAADPNFLAAQCLRERVLAPPEPVARSSTADPASSPPDSSVVPETLIQHPLVSAESYALFEQRVKRRRVDRCIDAVRTALQRRCLEDATAALNEAIELDPALPGRSALTAELDELRRRAAGAHGPWIAAAAVFIIAALGSWPPESKSLLSHPIIGSALLVSPPTPAVTVTASTSIATAGEGERPRDASRPWLESADTGGAEPIVVNRAPATVRASPSTGLPGRDGLEAASVAVAAPASVAVAGPASVAITGPLAQLPVVPRPVQPRPAVPVLALPAAAAATSVAMVNDELIIRQTLERYRDAYDGLDARSARAVYPAVNQAALARAFDGLQSQLLAFDACETQVSGGSATATCHGTTRYVPKIGSREPRTEPRIWSFTLSRNGDDWTIENARVGP